MTDVENVVVPRGAALVVHHRGRYATGEQLADDRARILDILGPDTRVLLIGDPNNEVGVHVVDDGARALVDAALALHRPDFMNYCPTCIDAEGAPVQAPCPTALALGVTS